MDRFEYQNGGCRVSATKTKTLGVHEGDWSFQVEINNLMTERGKLTAVSEVSVRKKLMQRIFCANYRFYQKAMSPVFCR